MNTKTILVIISLLLSILVFHANPADVMVSVSGAWIREVLPGQDSTAGYLVIENPNHQSDSLVAVACVCAGSIEVHRMIHDKGQMRMEPAGRLEIPALGKVQLEPGGTHLMFFGLKAPLPVGTKVKLTLRFEKAGEISVEAEVRAAEGKKPRGPIAASPTPWFPTWRSTASAPAWCATEKPSVKTSSAI